MQDVPDQILTAYLLNIFIICDMIKEANESDVKNIDYELATHPLLSKMSWLILKCFTLFWNLKE